MKKIYYCKFPRSWYKLSVHEDKILTHIEFLFLNHLQILYRLWNTDNFFITDVNLFRSITYNISQKNVCD